METSYMPRARRDELLVQVVSDELMVFDSTSERASVLNATAAFVWNHADGTRSVSDIAAAMSESFQTPIDTRVVWYAIDQLSKKNLMQDRAPVPAQYAHLTRRDLLTKAGWVGAALAIPVVITILAPTPAHAQSCALLPNGSACSQPFDCCSGCCAGFVCSVESSCL